MKIRDDRIMALAERIVEEDEGEFFYGSGFLNLIIATDNTVHEVAYIPLDGLTTEGINELVAILRENAPFEIDEMILRYWWIV